MSQIQRIKRRITEYIESKISEEDLQYWFAIKELTSREVKRKYARSYLGVLWSILQPLMHMIVMSLIFSYMFEKSIKNYPLYYLSGQIYWSLFSTATNSSLTALVDNKSFLLRTKLPKQTFIISRVYTAFVNFSYTFIAYVCILAFYRVRPSLTMLFFVIDLFLAILFSLGISYILSILYVFFADIKHLYGILLTIWMYLSAIFYPVESLPHFMQTIINFNPIYLFIYITRQCVIYNSIPAFDAWIKLFIYSITVYTIGAKIFDSLCDKVVAKL